MENGIERQKVVRLRMTNHELCNSWVIVRGVFRQSKLKS